MNFWILKSEPDVYSYDDLVKQGVGTWDGVRNYQARNNLQAMRKGDLAFFYHSNIGKEIVGIARIEQEAYPDPTVDDARWVAVSVVAEKKVASPVSCTQFNSAPSINHIALVKHSRLSVIPIDKQDFDYIIRLSESL